MVRSTISHLLRVGQTLRWNSRKFLTRVTAADADSGLQAKSSLVGGHAEADLSEQHFGEVLAYLSQLYGISFDATEYFFVKTGFSPYWHTCVDDFVPMGCPACEWSSRHYDLIDWRGEALVRLAEKMKAQRSAQMLLVLEPPNDLTGSSDAQPKGRRNEPANSGC